MYYKPDIDRDDKACCIHYKLYFTAPVNPALLFCSIIYIEVDY
jgi:hypothetical protein